MAIDYDEMRSFARELIVNNGRPVTLRRVVDAPPADPDQPWVVAVPLITDYDVVACFVSPDERHMPVEQSMPRETEHKETRTCFVDALSLDGVVPNLKDVVIDGGAQWGISLIDPVEPGVLPVYYVLTLEK